MFCVVQSNAVKDLISIWVQASTFSYKEGAL